MIKHNEQGSGSRKETFSPAKIREMREKAMQTGARPISTEGVRAVKCNEYYVGCNTITAKY